MTTEAVKLYSSMRFEGDGVTTVVALTFDLRKDDRLTVDFGEGILEGGYVVDFDSQPVLVIFDEPLPKDKTITIRRRTDIDRVPYVFQVTGNAQGGSPFNAFTIDTNFDLIVRASQDAMDSQVLASETLEEMAGIRDDSKKYRDEAKEFRDQAEVSKTSAGSSAFFAGNSAQQAEASKNLAYDWANKDVDVPVLNGEYSAKHWAEKSKESAGGLTPEIKEELDKKADKTYVDSSLESKLNIVDIAQEWGDREDVPLSQKFITSNLGYVTPEMFGAVGDGITDDTTAILDASIYSYNNKVRLLCDAEYIISSAIEINPIVIEGGLFIYTNEDSNISFKPAVEQGRSQGFKGSSFRLNTNVTNVFTTPSVSSNYSENRVNTVVKDIKIFGSIQNQDKYAGVYNEGADIFIQLGDTYGCEIDNVNIIGSYDIKQDPSSQMQCVGIKLNASSALMTARMGNIEISGCHTPLDVGDKVFYSLTSFDFIGAHIGIKNDSLGSFNEPKIFKGNINAQEIGISISNSGSREIDSVTIRRHRAGWKGADHDWYGIRIEKGNDLNVTSNTCHIDEGNGAFNGKKYGIYFKDSSLLKSVDNFISAGIDDGITFDNCTGIVESGTITAQVGTDKIIKSLINNTRLYNLGISSIVSTFNGIEVYLDDSSKLKNKTSIINSDKEVKAVNQPLVNEVIITNAPLESKIWREVVTSTSKNLQTAKDDGTGAVNYDIISRSGNSVISREIRGDQFVHINTPEFRINHAPVIVSDARSKLDVTDIKKEYFNVIERLKFKNYRYVGGNKLLFGIIAQDWIKSCEECGVNPYESCVLAGSEEEGYAIRYGELQNLFNAYILEKLKTS